MPKLKQKIVGYIGVDPGKSGGICSVLGWEAGTQIHSTHTNIMPETERDLWEIFRLTPNHWRACIEWIHPAMHGIAKSHMSKLYGNYMQCRAFLIAAKIPFEDVKPVEWQRSFGIPPRKKTENTNQWKNRLRAKAQQLFPSLDVWDKTKKVQLAVCDALLIAEYCKRKHLGLLTTQGKKGVKRVRR